MLRYNMDNKAAILCNLKLTRVSDTSLQMERG
jgi:hypothetical protein